ncbi:hypothetical protein SALBM311S_03517 [Streptomyces alboniger]
MSRVGLEGQVAVVTGAARGVGELLARKLSARGATVALVGLEPAALKEVCERLHGLTAATGTPMSPTTRRWLRSPGRSRSGSGRSTSSSPTRAWPPAGPSWTPTRRPGGG